MIRRNITYEEKSLIIPLYKAIVRPHLEYCIQAWNPHLRKDVDMFEKIQRRATKLIPGVRDLIYGLFLLKLPYYHQKMYLVFDIFCFYKFYIFLHDNGQVYLS